MLTRMVSIFCPRDPTASSQALQAHFEPSDDLDRPSSFLPVASAGLAFASQRLHAQNFLKWALPCPALACWHPLWAQNVFSCGMKLNVDYLVEMLWEYLVLTCIYTRKRG
uniref:uncharacterized protein LOC118147848 isoform X8 n=1 Tax=Callithrix jacchus TaxID=9483 RepID=UPI0023DCF3D6|nr:uncharacterized protein LOC118147848 isoform X8 [Callithrix jacchus]